MLIGYWRTTRRIRVVRFDGDGATSREELAPETNAVVNRYVDTDPESKVLAAGTIGYVILNARLRDIIPRRKSKTETGAETQHRKDMTAKWNGRCRNITFREFRNMKLDDHCRR
jgi:hypothetical protein